MRVFKKISYLTFYFLFVAKSVSAIELKGAKSTADAIGYKAQETAISTLPETIGTYINVFISLLGMVFIVLIWMGAFDIIAAGGNDEVVKKGRGRIKNGAIGILIILAAFFITKLILGLISGTGYFNTSSTSFVP